MASWDILLVFAVLQNGKLTATFPLGHSQVDLISSFWINPNITEAGLDLLEALAKVDEELNRSNEYTQIMLESGEEDDQLSRLLYRLQTRELQRNRINSRRRRKATSEDNPSPKHEELSLPNRRRPLTLNGGQKNINRENRKRKRSKEKRPPPNCKGKSRERHSPKGHERDGHRSREKPKPIGPRTKRIGPKTLERLGYNSKEKHRHKSREKCPTGDVDTTSAVTSPRPTTATLPSTSRNTMILTQNSSSPTSVSPGITPFTNLPAYTVGYIDNDASISYEKATFSPDAETLIPFL